MPFDTTIRLADVITLLVFTVGGLSFLWTMRSEIRMLAVDVKRQGDQIKRLEDIIIKQAVQDQRLNELDRRIEDLRHGRGFVQRDIDGMWGTTGRVKDTP